MIFSLVIIATLLIRIAFKYSNVLMSLHAMELAPPFST